MIFKMKRLIIALFILLNSGILFAQQKTVTLSGQLINFSNQVLVEDMSEFQYLDIPSSDRLIIPDSTGGFNITFKIAAPNYFRVGRNILYLTPGDNMVVAIDKNDPVKSRFKGTGAAANNYLMNTPFPKGGSFLEAGKNLKATPQETLAIITDAANKRELELEALKGVSPEFIRLEKARVKADALCSFDAVSSYIRVKKMPNPDEYVKMFNELAAPAKAAYEKGFIDPSLMKLVVYRDVAEDMIKDAPQTPGIQKIKDYYFASGVV